MADTRYKDHTALSGALADDDRVPMDKKTGVSTFATRYFTPLQMLAYVLANLATVAETGDYDDLDNLPTLGTAAALNVAASGNAASGEVVKGDDSRLADARTPTTHTHPQSDITGLVTVLSDLQAEIDGVVGAAITGLTGDGTASGPGNVAFTLATVNGNVGPFGGAAKTLTATVNAKGLVTAVAETNIAIAASQVTTGQLAMARGGTGADLSATGGSGQYVKQSSAGAGFTVGVIAAADLPTAIDAVKIANGSVSNAEFQRLAGVTSGIQAQLDLKASIAYADSLVVGLLDDRGNHDASGNVFPSTGGSGSAGAILKGDIWTISVGGILGGVVVTAGDMVRALVDTPGQTAGNWAVSETNIGYVALNAALNDGQIYIGNGSNVGTARTLSGDVTVDNTGVTAIGAGKVTNAMLAGSIAYSKLSLTGAIVNGDLAGSIANNKLANSSITIAGNATSLGGSVTQDQITGLSSTGLVKRTGANTLAIGVAATDYVAPGAVTTSGLTMATARLLGRSTASTGAIEEITVGSGLSLSGGTLSASGGAGSPGGSDTQLQYNSGGSFAGISGATSNGTNVTFGSGNLIATSPAFTTSATVTRTALGTTTEVGLELKNTTAAAAGAQQVSPATIWTGEGWKTNATAATQTVNFQAYVLPVQGAVSPTATWVLQSQINSGGWADRMTVDSAGVLSLPTSGSYILLDLAQGGSSLIRWGSATGRGIIPINNGLGFVNASNEIFLGNQASTSGRSLGIHSSGYIGWPSSGGGNIAAEVVFRRGGTGLVDIDNATAIGTTPGNARDLRHRASYFIETSSDPSASDVTIAGSNAKDVFKLYMKNDKLVVAYNNSGTVTYLSIPLDGSTTTFTHNTSAP